MHIDCTYMCPMGHYYYPRTSKILPGPQNNKLIIVFQKIPCSKSGLPCFTTYWAPHNTSKGGPAESSEAQLPLINKRSSNSDRSLRTDINWLAANCLPQSTSDLLESIN